MTAPDPELTDLIAAEIARHRLRYGSEDAYNGERWLCTTCPWLVEADTGSRPNVTVIQAHANHVAERLKLVVEQHTNGRTERIKTVLDAGANILDNHAAMLDNLVMDTPHDQTRSDQIAAQARRAAKSFRAALEGEQR